MVFLTGTRDAMEGVPLDGFNKILSRRLFLATVFALTGLCPRAESMAAKEQPQDEPQESTSPSLHVGGALRFNYFIKSWAGEEANRKKGGDFDFDTFRLNADGSHKDISISLEYRLYSGYNMLHHGYVGFSLGDESELQVGVSRKPLGLLPYASHNWFFDTTYYLGMEDDYDAGLKAVLPWENWDIQLAFYKNDEGHYSGNSLDSARYSYDVVHTDQHELGYAGVQEPRRNSETNQFNLRLARTLEHGQSGRTEVGISGEYGGLYNDSTAEMGNHWAAALHLNSFHGRFNLMLEALTYDFRPENPVGQDRSFIVMGAYDAPYKVAARGNIYLANLAYTLPVDGSIIQSLTFYDNYTYLAKSLDEYADSRQNVLGVLVTAGQTFTYIDFAMGKNHPWLGADYGRALAEGDHEADWEYRFNINLGYYF